MKTHFYLFFIMAALAFAGCNSSPKQADETTATPPSKAEETVPEVAEAVEQPVLDFSQCDMVMLDEGKLFFYNTATSEQMPYLAETDSVVNCVFTSDDKVYYCVALGEKILLRCIDVDQPDPQPQQLADWGVPYEKCVTETYGTVSPLMYYADRHMLGLHHEFSWDGYDFSEQKLYNIDNGQITDWDYETWLAGEPVYISDDEEQTEENYQYVRTADELREYLTMKDGQYYMTDGDDVCLTDRIDCASYASDPEYYSGPEFEYISSSPDNSKVLYMIIVEWGDYPHGILAVSSFDGTFQLPLEDTDCTGFNAEWLDDGSLVYVGEAPLSPDDPANDDSWHYRGHCIKRIYPDGTTKIISDCGDFQVKQSMLH